MTAKSLTSPKLSPILAIVLTDKPDLRNYVGQRKSVSAAPFLQCGGRLAP
jgi:hypothetical protein